jgi:hypothetical protein
MTEAANSKQISQFNLPENLECSFVTQPPANCEQPPVLWLFSQSQAHHLCTCIWNIIFKSNTHSWSDSFWGLHILASNLISTDEFLSLQELHYPPFYASLQVSQAVMVMTETRSVLYFNLSESVLLQILHPFHEKDVILWFGKLRNRWSDHMREDIQNTNDMEKWSIHLTVISHALCSHISLFHTWGTSQSTCYVLNIIKKSLVLMRQDLMGNKYPWHVHFFTSVKDIHLDIPHYCFPCSL